LDNKVHEWFKQSEYDLDTAMYMSQGDRYFYAVFMCHLSVEKALKGLYLEKLRELPPKTHNLIWLLNKIQIKPDKQLGKFIAKLNEANVATRYPEDIEILKSNYNKEIAESMITQTSEAVQWIKDQL
jgi:HEPN domain-containing protein